MPIHAYQSEHVFGENRLYLTNASKEITKGVVYNVGESIGAGIRSYSKPIGWILSIFHIATKVEIDDESFYVNNRSFAKYIIRANQIYEPSFYNEGNLKSTINKLHSLFIKYKNLEKVYKTDDVENIRNSIVKNETLDTKAIQSLLNDHAKQFSNQITIDYAKYSED